MKNRIQQCKFDFKQVAMLFFIENRLLGNLIENRQQCNFDCLTGYTASSLGNHEFDDGVGDLVKFAREVTDTFPVLACNLVIKNSLNIS